MELPIGLLTILIAFIAVINVIKTKNANKAFLRLSNDIDKFNGDMLQLKRAYISHSQQENFLWKYSNLVKNLESIKRSVSRQNKDICTSVVKRYYDLKAEVPKHNEKFVIDEISACKALFSNIDGHQLDTQQKRAIVTDEDHNLVLAGAGSGKTLTITGKIKYLCDRKGISPDDILLIAFTRKAAAEMTERIRKMGIMAEAVTFHKLGLDIISKARGSRPDVLEDGEMRQFMENFFKNHVLDNLSLVKSLIQYFAYYIHIPSDLEKFDSLGAAYEHERNTDFETFKSKYISDKASEFSQNRQTLKGETVKSLEEVSIANFFFLHGINYEYERNYPFNLGDRYRKRYTPDFYLPDYDIYLEHFGINKEGKTPWLSAVESEKYISDMRWKRELHRKCNTKLLETYSWYTTQGILLTSLEKLLRDNGVKLKEPDYLDIYKRIYSDVSDKYFREFIQLCSTFLTLFKSNGYCIDDLHTLDYKSDDYKNSYHRERLRVFISIIEPILREYQAFLAQKDKVDFSDMIIAATQAVTDGANIRPYKYVIIDEFQDISMSRYRLIKAILARTSAHLLCVGDDWQSIYRFSGSDLHVFTNFEKSFGASQIMHIDKTYRNSQQLIDSAARFIMKNPAQIKKDLKSDKSLEKPISFWIYEKNPYDTIRIAIHALIHDYGESKSIMFLGRTKYDENILLESTLFSKNGNRLIYKRNPHVDVSFLTVHKAKGLEADNVIILNFNNSLLGFPNKIADDPLLELVLSTSDTYLYGEERRLLYVALTRTRNRVLLITDNQHPSEFKHDFDKDNNVFDRYVGSDHTAPISCPKCKTGHLLIRSASATNRNFVGCTNYPQCTYTVNDTSILDNPIKCSCGGFMIVKNSYLGSFYGCSNYPTCKNTREIR